MCMAETFMLLGFNGNLGGKARILWFQFET